MESMGSSKKPRRRRSFTPEFKAEIVDLCQRGDRSVGQVAKDFDLTETAVREWVKQAGRDAGTVSDGGLATEERTELAQLRAAERQLPGGPQHIEGRVRGPAGAGAAGPPRAPSRPQARRPDHARQRPARPGGEAVAQDHDRRSGGCG